MQWMAATALPQYNIIMTFHWVNSLFLLGFSANKLLVQM